MGTLFSHSLENVLFVPKDIPLLIAIRTDPQTITALICTCKYYLEYPNIWKLACETQFPNKPYFDFWTGKENYLVHGKKNFVMVVDYIRLPENVVSNIIYERSCYLYHQYRSQNVHFEVDGQFILIIVTESRIVSLVGQYETCESAKEIIKSHQLQINYVDYYDKYIYIIVDLKHTIPYFKNSKSRGNKSTINPGTYYYGSIGNPIIFS
jgi:hypothetical protein